MLSIEIPESLSAKAAVFHKYFANLEHPLRKAVQYLLLTSNYASKKIKHLQTLLAEDDCLNSLCKSDYYHLCHKISFDAPQHVFSQALRQFRHQQLLRLQLREIAGLSSTPETMTAWSDCADAIIQHALVFCQHELSKRFGRPYHLDGEPASLHVLAMGKLGGRELNFSSDIDLIFAYSADGQTNGKESINNQTYFIKVVQLFLQLLQAVTSDGFVFRVDLRLRPNGESGALVLSLAAMETYYQERGRDWERYAMVKARVIGGQPAWFHRLITPFVYRRYVDFSVIESLRSMKAMIEREVQLNRHLDDIKRGRGGIREVEFITQCFQLIRGGRLPQIQKQNAIEALNTIEQEGLLRKTGTLKKAYLFLRKLENALQILDDQQTHSLPSDVQAQTQIALAMGYTNSSLLLTRLDQYRKTICHAFQSILKEKDVYADEKRLLNHQLSSLWHGHVETSLAINLLTSLGFHNPQRCYQLLHGFRHGPRCRRLTQTARLRLDRFMVLLLHALKDLENTDEVLLQVLRLLENIVARSAYLALLAENPTVLQEVLYWFAHSPFITSLLVSQPFLLEVLVDQEQTWQPLSKKKLQDQLRARMVHCKGDELQNEALRQFKLTCWLLAARAELYNQCNAIRISQFLADVAEVIITEVLSIACQQLSTRHPQIMKIKSRFAIIAYGKLGSQEMNYDSDVDLVFLHAAEPSEESLITRLTQKVLHFLTIRTQAGILYTVDTRLRPSGSAGLLVSHIDAFFEYQCRQAWTWEHQAILRARVLLANQRIRAIFNRLKEIVLLKPREKKELAENVQSMRAKIHRHTAQSDIKHATGGLLDLEFLVQYLVLANPSQALVRHTKVLAQLKHLQQNGVLSSWQRTQLESAYRYYHQILHQSLLKPEPYRIKEKSQNVSLIASLFFPSS